MKRARSAISICALASAAGLAALALLLFPARLCAQATSTTVQGVVEDPSGAVIAGARVHIANLTSGFSLTAVTGKDGRFRFDNVPLDQYQITVAAPGFATTTTAATANSGLAVNLTVRLPLPAAKSTVTVEAVTPNAIENTATTHFDVSRKLFSKIPLESASSSLSSLVTLAAPGVTADSNGLFHGMGDHADNSFSVDGQPVTDQQSKVFSNELPVQAVQTLKVIEGAPPAQYGDKTSLVIVATTRSGEGDTKPHGDASVSYGSFGTSTTSFDLGYGGQTWGNFLAASGLNTSRFLDPPQFTALHDHGNEENLFDRVDFQSSNSNLYHLDMEYTRSWFQTPNAIDNLHLGVTGPNGLPLGPTNQRSMIQTVNFSPSWTHIISSDQLFELQAWFRRDGYHYYPSPNPLADLNAPSLQRETVGQYRTLANLGGHLNWSYSRGAQTILAGVMVEQTFLNEQDRLGIVDATYNAPCLTASTASDPNTPVDGFTSPGQCAAAGDQPNLAGNPNAPGSALYPYFNPALLPYDLTRGGSLYPFNGTADIKEEALYFEDDVHLGNWTANLGLRQDFYNGLTSATQTEPRLGVAYHFATGTVLSGAYARTLETPFNENLVLSSVGCASPVLNPMLGCVSNQLSAVLPGYRNSFYLGLQQQFGSWVVFNGEYQASYTRNAYDFSVLGDTPITFPIAWAKSKTPGFVGRFTLLPHHGVTGFFDFSHIAARFFTPQVAGAGQNPAAPSGVFRIDHDEVFNSTTHLQYELPGGEWVGFNWRYDSGLVAGAAPCYGTKAFNNCLGSVLVNGVPSVSMIVPNAGGIPMTADQEYEGGFYCGTEYATPTQALPATCPVAEFGSTLISLPAPNTENDDFNPPRIAPRSLFDMAVGDDRLFPAEGHHWSLTATVVNLTNKVALYNFLSTFSGTHYVTPRAYTLKLAYHF